MCSPSASGELKSIRVNGRDLEPGDVVLKTPYDGVYHYRIDQITVRSGAYISARCTDLNHPDAPVTSQRFGSYNTLETVIAGPKLDAAHTNPSLVQRVGVGWNWLGYKEAAKA